jgi:chromosome segregation ATPase
MVVCLIQNFSMTVKGNMISMRREPFVVFMSGFLKISSGINMQEDKDIEKSNFKFVMTKVNQFVVQLRKNIYLKRLKIVSNTVNRKINPYEFRHEFRETTTKMSNLISEKEGLEEAVQRLTNKKLSVETICSEKERETREFEMKLYDSRAEYDSITQRLEDIAKRLQEEEARLARVEEDAAVRMKHIEEEAEKVRTFVERQKERPIMEYAA